MNERIEACFKKAINNQLPSGSKKNYFWSVTPAEVEKFAELIVRECADSCLREGDKWRGVQDITDFRLCAAVVKEHFGIE